MVDTVPLPQLEDSPMFSFRDMGNLLIDVAQKLALRHDNFRLNDSLEATRRSIVAELEDLIKHIAFHSEIEPEAFDGKNYYSTDVARVFILMLRNSLIKPKGPARKNMKVTFDLFATDEYWIEVLVTAPEWK